MQSAVVALLCSGIIKTRLHQHENARVANLEQGHQGRGIYGDLKSESCAAAAAMLEMLSLTLPAVVLFISAQSLKLPFT
jgi:hypothetical protein